MLLFVLQFGSTNLCRASVAVVPDEFATVQLGIDSGADTILVRAGTYSESPMMSAAPNRNRIVLVADPAASTRPTLQGLTVSILDHETGDLNVVGLRVLNQVTVRTHSVIARYGFEACLFEAGLGHGGLPPAFDHAGSLNFLRCMIRGATDMTVGSLTMESDTVEMGGTSFHTLDPVRVRNSWFRDSPIGLRVFNRSGGASDEVVGNQFENCGTGLRVYDADNMANVIIQDNRFQYCRDWGVRVEHAEDVDVVGNTVWRCGVGIGTWYTSGPTHVIGNTVTEGTRHGIEIFRDYYGVEIRDNTVVRCMGSGVWVDDWVSWSNDGCRITGNTSALNGGSGYDVRLYNPDLYSNPYAVSNNISHRNGNWGFAWDGPGSPTLLCNDWFDNTVGVVYGAAPGTTDLSIDPLFCDPASGDVRLRSDSPLLGGVCGTIGSEGVGCDASTEVLVAHFSAEASEQGVGIRWRLGGDELPLSVWIERSDGELGPWRSIATDRSMDGAVTIEWDRTAELGRRYWYRLAWTTSDGPPSYSSPIVIELSSPSSSVALNVIGPNPASGPVTVEYTLPRSAVIALTVHDLMGREVARLASGLRTQGRHVQTWDAEAHGTRAHPGVYFIRLTWPEGSQSRRILLRR
jgi:hypothetical protein